MMPFGNQRPFAMLSLTEKIFQILIYETPTASNIFWGEIILAISSVMPIL